MLSHAFDSLFSSLSGFIPVAFLRSLSYNESGLNPDKVTPSSKATGLFQVVQKVLDDFNLQHGTSYTLEDVKDPSLNAQIGISLVSRIVKSYQKNHPNSLAMNWQDPRYVSLVVQGFNAGYSETGGVGYVVGRMEAAGVPPERITVDTVSEATQVLNSGSSHGASRFLAMPNRVGYAKAVARTYFNELGRTAVSGNVPYENFPQRNADSDELKIYASLNKNNVLDYVGEKVAESSKEDDKHIHTSNWMGNVIVLMAFPFIGMVVSGIKSKLKKRKHDKSHFSSRWATISAELKHESRSR